MRLWSKITDTSLGIIPERITASIPLPLNDSFVYSSITKISGNFPPGLRLEGKNIIGTPFEVIRTTVFKFVIRATSGNYFEDRTFSLTVIGADEPQWITQEGLLDIGVNNTLFIIDTSPVDYQLQASDTDLAAGDELEYFIKDGNGVLPPGLELTLDGRIVGIVEPLISLDAAAGTGKYDSNKYAGYPYDFGILPDNGFSSFYYDSLTYDLSINTKSPRKLNRYYEFIVTVSDGETNVDRKFLIYLVGDDFLRADNTIMKGSTSLFTADNTHVRTPIWLTPANLGFRRANNYLTLFFDIVDSPYLVGKVLYTLEDFNNDGTASTLPPGLRLDQNTGELAGRVPYQPAVTKEYKFTLNATRFTGEVEVLFITGIIYEDTLMGKSSFKVYKLDRSLADGIDDLQELVGRFIDLNGFSYKVIAAEGTSEEYDEIFLDRTLNPQISLIPVTTVSPGDDFMYVARLTQPQREKLQDKFINFDSDESHQIQKVLPYIIWEVKSRSGGTIAIDFGAAGIDQPSSGESLEEQVQRLFSNVLGPTYVDGSDESLIRITTPVTSNSTINILEKVFVSADSTANDIRITEIANNRDRIFLDSEISRTVPQGNNIGISLFSKDSFEKELTATSEDETTIPSSKKTFTLNVLGEVDSTITWNTSNDLGIISANFQSTFAVSATTTIPNAKLVYTLTEGRLPPGLDLLYDGEIVGKVRQFGDGVVQGLTIFDEGNCTFDSATTTIDRQFSFTVDARDRFGYSAIQRTFTITVIDPNDLLYSNLFLKPLLKQTQRDSLRSLISDSTVFPPSLIYRPNDPEFGLQTDARMLTYAGIETKNIDEYVAAATKHHKKRRYKVGELKKAEAKEAGTNNIVYEVVYLEIIDPAEPVEGKTRKKIQVKNTDKITVDSISYAVKEDQFKTNSGIPSLTVGTVQWIDDTYYVETREGEQVLLLASEVDVLTEEGDEIIVTRETDSDPFKYRPEPGANTIKADSDAINVSDGADAGKYISNITNMRNEIRNIGVTERDFLPLWMRTPQEGGVKELGFTLAMPLCYTNPGGADQIILNVRNTQYDFKQLDLEIDRYIIDSTTGTSEEQYILFANYEYNA